MTFCKHDIPDKAVVFIKDLLKRRKFNKKSKTAYNYNVEKQYAAGIA